MKLKFKKQAYQTQAVEAVVACFAGQPKREGLNYRIDPGRAMDASGQAVAALETSGLKTLTWRLLMPKFSKTSMGCSVRKT
jgi:type III restriction enzyme